jgi:hypothetical protein
VAENSSVWRCAAARENRLQRRQEAHVEHAVGLVQHQDLDADRSTVRCSMWSSRRPGVATTMSTPRLSASICGLMPTPPKMAATRRMRSCAVVASDSCTCAPARGWAPAPARRGLPRAATGRRPAALDHRQRERRGLAGAGLGAGQQVAARQHDGDGLLLETQRRGSGMTDGTGDEP